jgi:hypothetical protein
MRLGSIPEFDDERMAIERLLHDASLHALAASVNQTDLGEAGLVRSRHVLVDDRRDVARRERVEVEALFDRNAHINAQPIPNSQENRETKYTLVRLGVGRRALGIIVSCSLQ